MNNLTPGELDLFNNPNTQLAVELLDLVVIPSKSYKTNIAVADRVNQWLASFPQATKAVISEDVPSQPTYPWTIVDPGALKCVDHPIKGWPNLIGKTISAPF